MMAEHLAAGFGEASLACMLCLSPTARLFRARTSHHAWGFVYILLGGAFLLLSPGEGVFVQRARPSAGALPSSPASLRGRESMHPFPLRAKLVSVASPAAGVAISVCCARDCCDARAIQTARWQAASGHTPATCSSRAPIVFGAPRGRGTTARFERGPWGSSTSGHDGEATAPWALTSSAALKSGPLVWERHRQSRGVGPRDTSRPRGALGVVRRRHPCPGRAVQPKQHKTRPPPRGGTLTGLNVIG